MRAYYNEIDPYAAQWLRNLIEAGHIAPGDVDQRSIEDVTPKDLHGYTQCHFFAGIGVWSHALRKSGWTDDRPVWTGSCPCQPFSAAGKGGGFDDERHLWPAFHHLIRICRPPIVIGEQVASRDGLSWLDLVSSDMEGEGYTFGAVDTCAAGVGAPHIRQRLYWVANANDERCERQQDKRAPEAIGEGVESPELREQSGPLRTVSSGMADAKCGAAERGGFDVGAETGDPQAEAWKRERIRIESGPSEYFGGVGDALNQSRQRGAGSVLGEKAQECREGVSINGDKHNRPQYASQGLGGSSRGPTNGHWRASDWIHCRDGKWRPVEASPQPMVNGSAESLGRVRPEVITKITEEINAAAMEAKIDAGEALRALQQYLVSQAGQFWQAGRVPGLSTPPFLLSFLRQLSAQGWDFSQSISLPCPQTAAWELRVLRINQAFAGSPHQRGLEEQPEGQFANFVHLLSSILARYTHSAWDEAYETYAEIGFPLGINSKARVGRLRAYGNAIVAQQAQAFIEAVMDNG